MKRCALQHFGLWLVHEQWFSQAVAAYRNGDLKPQMDLHEDDDDAEWFQRGPNGMLILPIRGQITKRASSFGGTSSVETRRILRDASLDESVTGVMLFIDSPGGTAAGTFELAEEVRRFAEVKPIKAHIEDLGASAAFWVASQTQSISINQLGEAGSIGTIAVLIDSSQAMENSGLKVHVISTGEFKGAGTPGTEVTDRQLALFKEQVEDFNQHFLEGVSQGRGLTGAALSRVATGRVWIAEKALALGLVDEVMSFEDAITKFSEELKPELVDRSGLNSRIRMAEIELELSCSKKQT